MVRTEAICRLLHAWLPLPQFCWRIPHPTPPPCLVLYLMLIFPLRAVRARRRAGGVAASASGHHPGTARGVAPRRPRRLPRAPHHLPSLLYPGFDLTPAGHARRDQRLTQQREVREEGPREVTGEHNICIIFFIFLFMFFLYCLSPPPVLSPIAVLQGTDDHCLAEVGPGVEGCRRITYK